MEVKKVRKIATKESVLSSFDELNSFIEETLNNVDKNKRVLKSVAKRIKKLKHRTERVFKLKRKTNPSNPLVRKGFMKPTKLSLELRSFCNLEDVPVYRSEAVKIICNYIKENKLNCSLVVAKDKTGNVVRDENGQEIKKVDGRFIVPDDKLKTLLTKDYDSSVPLTFFTLQKHLKYHFVPNV